MVEKTCAACDCKLDANAIKVKIGGKTVEVCCDGVRTEAEGSARFRDCGEEGLKHKQTRPHNASQKTNSVGRTPYRDLTTENPDEEVLMARVYLLASLAGPAFGTTLYPAGVKSAEACAFATKPVFEIVSGLAYPADWRIIIACTDGEWWDIVRRFDATTSLSAFTIRDAKVTVINARIFREKIYSGPPHTLRHELGHIVCNSKSEEVAERFASSGVCR